MSSARDATFSPELRLLLALLRRALGAAAPISETETRAVAWPDFLALLERHRLAPFLHQRARDELAAICPPAVVDAVQRSAHRTVQRALAQAAEQRRLTGLLAEAGIELLVVKGLALAERLHGGIGARHVGDIDLVVRPADVARADAVLQAAGLRRTRPDIALTPLQFEKFLQLKPEFEYISAAGFRVELLWRLEGLPPGHDVWAESRIAPVPGRAVRTLGAETEALYLVQHGARHGWFRLFWLVDIALLWRDTQVAWPRVMSTARAHQQETAVFEAVALTEALLGAPAPDALRPSPTQRPRVEPLVRECLRLIARTPAEHEPVGEWARQLRYRVRLQQTLRGKWSVLAPHLLTPESWRTWPLPDRWFFLYYFAAPFLWLWRRLRR